jgi:acetyl esterase/lipase
MRASSERFAADLIAAGAEVERHVLPDTRHAFLNRPQLPEFAVAIDRIFLGAGSAPGLIAQQGCATGGCQHLHAGE